MLRARILSDKTMSLASPNIGVKCMGYSTGPGGENLANFGYSGFKILKYFILSRELYLLSFQRVAAK